jgi:hypothetical protein
MTENEQYNYAKSWMNKLVVISGMSENLEITEAFIGKVYSFSTRFKTGVDKVGYTSGIMIRTPNCIHIDYYLEKFKFVVWNMGSAIKDTYKYSCIASITDEAYTVAKLIDKDLKMSDVIKFMK